MGKYLFILIALSLNFSVVSAQQVEVDSLTALLLKVEDPTKKVDVLNELAFYYTSINPSVAKDDVNIALDLARKINYGNGIARSYSVSGSIYWSLSNYTESLNMYYKALGFYEDQENMIGIAICYNNIAEVYKNTGDLLKSLEYHEKSLKIKQKIFNPLPSYISHINIAELYVQLGRLEEARTYFNLVVANELNVSNRQIAYAYVGLAQIELEKKNFYAAQNYLNIALKIRKERNDQRGIAKIYSLKGLVLQGLNQSDSANYYFIKAIATAKNIGARDIIANSYLHLSHLDSSKKDFENAYFNYMQYTNIKDSILNEEKLRQIARIQTDYENTLLHKENEANVIKVRQQNTLIIGIFMLMFFAVAVAWAFYRQQKGQKKVNFLLASKNKEISRQNKEIHRQSEKLIMLNKKLEKLNESLEGKVKERTQILIEQNKKLAEYAYTNAHELRAPVANILGLVNLLTYSSDLSSKEQQIVEHLMKATAELDSVIIDIRQRLEKENKLREATPPVNNLSA